ncbi:23S rRNA pseudouridine(955/2504/2580) synthase RluC [Pseudomonas aeruginosa]
MTTPASPTTGVQLLDVPPELAGQRIDNFLIARLKGAPKTLIYRILRKGEVRVNKGRIKPDYRLQAGDQVRVPPLRLAERDEPAPLAQGLLERMEAAIVYEDKALIVVNKPAGIAVHGGSGVSAGVIEVFRQLRPDAKDIELVHRLDRDTSGLLMIAKKRSMLRHLHEALRGEKIVDKRYHALVRGHWPAGKKNVRAPLLKNNLRSGERMVEVNVEGKDALTEFRVLRRFGDFATLVEARPITGRTHQIRVHAKHAGHAIAGDPKYGDEDFSREIRELGGKRLFARIVDSMKAAARETALPERDDTRIKGIIGLGLPEAIASLYPEVGDPALVERFRCAYSEHYLAQEAQPSRLFPGVAEAMVHFREAGFRLAVATGKSRRGLDRVLAGHGWSDFFDITRCADETASKPDPLMLHEILAHCRVEPGRALMIGDSPFDLEMARRAGMDSVAVAYGAQSLEQLRPYAPRLEVEHFTELRAWLGGARREAVSGVVEHV